MSEIFDEGNMRRVLGEHIPEVEEAFTYGPLTVTVKEMDDQRVTKLLVEKETSPEEEADQEK